MGIKKNNGRDHQHILVDGIKVMCRIFWGPDTEMCRRMIDRSFFSPFQAIIAHSKEASEDLLNDIHSFSDQFETHDALKDHLETCYIHLFVNNANGIIPLYQSCYEYEGAPMMGGPAQKMAALFASKGLSLAENVNEPPDHLSIELEYLLFLLEEELENQNTNEGRSYQQESESFASEVMLPWLTRLCEQLEPGPDECRFFFLSTRLLIQLLEMIAR